MFVRVHVKNVRQRNFSVMVTKSYFNSDSGRLG